MKKELKILVFKLKNEFYATDIMDVERILGYEEPTALPDSPEFLAGVIKYENSLIPVLSLAKKFNFVEANEGVEKKIVVIKKLNMQFGIIVDDVYEVRDITESEIEESDMVSTFISKRYIKGLVKRDNIIILLDLSKILSQEEEMLIF